MQDKSVPEGMLSEKGKRTLNEDVINMLLNFEIKEVCICLYPSVKFIVTEPAEPRFFSCFFSGFILSVLCETVLIEYLTYTYI